jgi:hypothetical protein
VRDIDYIIKSFYVSQRAVLEAHTMTLPELNPILNVILYGALKIALSVENSIIFWLFSMDKAIFKHVQ